MSLTEEQGHEITEALQSIAASLAVIAADVTARKEQAQRELIARCRQLRRDAEAAGNNFSVYDRAQMNGRGDPESLKHWERESDRLWSEYQAFIVAHPEVAEA